MGNDHWKSERERERFRAFADVAGLKVAPGSIESRKPREPDILCTIEGRGPVAFELVECVDEGFAEMESLAARGKNTGAISYRKEVLTCIREKCRDKSYETSHPIELLVWGGESELELAQPVGPSTKDRAQQLLDMSVFQRLWVVRFSRRQGHSLWLALKRSSRASDGGG